MILLTHDSLPMKQITEFQCDLPPMHISTYLRGINSYNTTCWRRSICQGPPRLSNERLWVFRPTHESWPSNVMMSWLQSVQRPALCKEKRLHPGPSMAADGSGWQRMAMKTSTIPLFWYSNALRYLRYPLQKEITW